MAKKIEDFIQAVENTIVGIFGAALALLVMALYYGAIILFIKFVWNLF